MFFWFKNSKLKVETFVHEQNFLIAKNMPIFESTIKNCSWWRKEEPSKFDFDQMKQSLSVRSCVGIINFLRAGLVVPLWSDLAFKNEVGGWQYQFADKISNIQSHSIKNFYNDYHVIKIENPWYIKTDDYRVKFLFTDPFYYNPIKLPFLNSPGITQIYHSIPLNFFWFFNKNVFFEKIIEYGTPVLQMIPLTEKTIDFKINVLDHKEFQNTTSSSRKSFFMNRGLKLKKEFFKLVS